MKCHYGFSSYNVTLQVDEGLPYEWIDSYLAPFFRNRTYEQGSNLNKCVIGDESDTSWTVEAKVSERQIKLYERLFEKLAEKGCVTKYPELATSYASIGANYLVRQSDPDTLAIESWLSIAPADRMAELYVSPDNSEAPYVVARAVRSIVIGQALSDGWSVLHASCVKVGESGFLTVGSKGAGKTALMMSLITQRQGSYVSNDKLLAKRIDGSLHVHGLPHSPAVKVEMLERYGLANVQTDYIFQGTPTKRRFLVDELCNALGTTIAPHVRVRAILLPHYRCEKSENLGPASFERFRAQGNPPNRQTAAILDAAQMNSICDFQPVWMRVFNTGKTARLPWWHDTEILRFCYDNESLENIVMGL